MKRRARYEVQRDTDVPSYEHSVIFCDSGEGVSTDIIYNSLYSVYGSGVHNGSYDRDNYCVIPLTVPSMSLNKSTPYIPKSIGDIPSISSMLDLEYDYTILTDNTLDLISIVGGDITSMLNNLDFCVCTTGGSVHKGTIMSMAPLDSLTTMISVASDEYAYTWEDTWDMATLPTFSPSRNRNKKPGSSSSSSSSSVSVVMINAVYLGTVSDPGPGIGGISIVSVNSVGGTGGGGNYPVNFPAIP